mmetsp:Transcript_85631/g.266272  ORF Transcript_85631/g.266272 Transcript_85631/m.266272 type:complete len:352 (-) Transcript_85631:6-1061(-)
MRSVCTAGLAAAITALFAASLAGANGVNTRPVVGIYSAPLYETAPECEHGCDYVAASYVKWLESAGAESLPIPYGSTEEQVEQLFPQLNGVLFPGGGASLPRGARSVLRLALAANDNGTHFPVWGTCLGFEWLLEMLAGRGLVESGFDAENISLALNLTTSAASSRLLGPLSAVPGHRDRSRAAASQLRRDLANDANPPAMNGHERGLSPSRFAASEELSGFFTVLSTNLDRKGRAFVSTIEAKKYPIYGVQWHPEKNNFEWGLRSDGRPFEAINHSPEAVFASQSLADTFVGECRRNGRRRDLADPGSRLFRDYPSSQARAPEFEQVYLIPRRAGAAAARSVHGDNLVQV